MNALSDIDRIKMRGTVGTTEALALLESMGLYLEAHDLARARGTGDVDAIRIGTCWRYSYRSLQALVEQRLGAFPELPPGTIEDPIARKPAGRRS